MTADSFTQVQLDALTEIERNRLTVVRAGPGSGKTRVFVEALRRELERWTSTRAGVAALSFTNVAHEVISDRLGGATGGPHFVGTLDAFLWRFVVRPFGHLVGITSRGATLIPSPLDEALSNPKQKYGSKDWQNDSIFKLSFTGGTEPDPVLFHWREKLKLVAPFSAWCLQAKRREWGGNGRVTHSDSQYLASCILHGQHSAAVIDLLVRRFPVILVDEFQDTGWFLSRSLLAILRCQRVRGALVGDPDQAIYQFGGAHRGLFADAEAVAGRQGFLLAESHRCGAKVASVATALSRSGKAVIPKSTSPEGRAVLMVHDSDVPRLDAVLTSLSDALAGMSEIAVLARKASTVKLLANVTSAHSCPWKSGIGHRMAQAVEALLARDPSTAARLVHRELGELLLGDETVTHVAVRTAGIPWREWRRACHTVLMTAMRTPDGETWNAWMARLKKQFGDMGVRLSRPIDAKTLGARFKKASDGGDALRGVLSQLGTTSSWPILTVHQAKGREFDAIVLCVPRPHAANAPCPSDEWWSSDPASEEREVAFVACSRPRNFLALVVHRKTFNALQSKRPAFVNTFEVLEIDVSVETRKSLTKRQPRVPDDRFADK